MNTFYILHAKWLKWSERIKAFHFQFHIVSRCRLSTLDYNVQVYLHEREVYTTRGDPYDDVNRIIIWILYIANLHIFFFCLNDWSITYKTHTRYADIRRNIVVTLDLIALSIFTSCNCYSSGSGLSFGLRLRERN